MSYLGTHEMITSPVSLCIHKITMNSCQNLLKYLFISALFILFTFNMMKSAESQEISESTVQGEVRRGVFRPSEDSASFWGEIQRQRILSQLEPSGKPTPAKINQYIETYKRLVIYDPRVTAFQVQGKQEKGKIILSGVVSYQEEKDGILNTLGNLKIGELVDKIEVLPSPNLGEKRYAIAIAPNVPFFSHPTGRQERVTEAILGDSIFLLKEDNQNGYYLAQYATGYVGWIKQDLVKRVDIKEFQEWRNKDHALFLKSFRDEDNKVYIPMSADLRIDSTGKILFPDGNKISIPAEYYKKYTISKTNRAEQILNSAKEFLGTEYVWGGVTLNGIDCSGFTQTLYKAYGVNLPRDANQQVITGEIVGWRGYTDDLLPGDLLFFISGNGRIGHVAMYAGNQRYIHAQEPRVKFSSFNPGDEFYDFKTNSKFVIAKRILRAE